MAAFQRGSLRGPSLGGAVRRAYRSRKGIDGRRAPDRPADPSRPVLVAVASLLGDDLVLDPVVGRLRHHLLLYKLVLGLIRPVLDDLLGVGLADALHRLQLVGRGAVDVKRLLVSAARACLR